VRYPFDTTVAVIDASATALASIIAPITGCTLIRQRIIFRAKQLPRDVADTGSSTYNSGVLIFTTDDDGPNELLAVPGILDSVLLTDGPTAGYGIDTANSDIQALIMLLTGSIYTNPFGDALNELTAAYRQSRT
jgi:hypothetical protein